MPLEQKCFRLIYCLRKESIAISNSKLIITRMEFRRFLSQYIEIGSDLCKQNYYYYYYSIITPLSTEIYYFLFSFSVAAFIKLLFTEVETWLADMMMLPYQVEQGQFLRITFFFFFFFFLASVFIGKDCLRKRTRKARKQKLKGLESYELVVHTKGKEYPSHISSSTAQLRMA